MSEPGRLTAVRDELAALAGVASQVSLASMQDGSWLVAVLRETVNDYTDTVDGDSLRALYPGLDADEVVQARIADAQWRATLAGGTSAGAYASVVMASLATGAFVGAALPAAVTAFAVDLCYQARVQICLAWDLSQLYGTPLDPARDDDLWTLTRVAFGVDAQTPTSALAKPTVPLASRFGTRALTTAARLGTGVSAVGRSFALRSMAKFAIPAVGVVLCAGVNHISTGAVGRSAKAIFRDRAAGRGLAADVDHRCALTVCAVLLLLHADDRLARAELAAIRGLDQGLQVDRAALDLSEAELVARIAAATDDVKLAVWEAANAAAELDGVVHPEEERLLALLAKACGVEPTARS